jgi:predicted O-methyltransferase YrrM
MPLCLDRTETRDEITTCTSRWNHNREWRRLYGVSVASAHPKGLPIPKALRRLFVEMVIADRERRGASFADVEDWPERIRGFADLAFLFSSTILAHGIASLRFDEAAYLYRLVREVQPRTVVEIGRYRGGSTFVFATALEAGVVHSYDLETRQGSSGVDLDAELIQALERYGLRDRVCLHIADSRTADPPAEDVEFLFIDGDHAERGARADFDHWAPRLPPRGHLLIHDAVDAVDFSSPSAAGPARVAAQVGPDFVRQRGAGSLAHFIRRS